MNNVAIQNMALIRRWHKYMVCDAFYWIHIKNTFPKNELSFHRSYFEEDLASGATQTQNYR